MHQLATLFDKDSDGNISLAELHSFVSIGIDEGAFLDDGSALIDIKFCFSSKEADKLFADYYQEVLSAIPGMYQGSKRSTAKDVSLWCLKATEYVNRNNR